MSRSGSRRKYVLIIWEDGDPSSVDLCDTVGELAEAVWDYGVADDYLAQTIWKDDGRDRNWMEHYMRVNRMTLKELGRSSARAFVRGVGEYVSGLAEGSFGHAEWDSIDGRRVEVEMMDEYEARNCWWYQEGDWSTSSKSPRGRPSPRRFLARRTAGRRR